MRKLLPAVILLITLAALAAGPALAQEKPTEPPSPPTEKPGKTLKIVTAGSGEEAGADDEALLCAPETCAPSGDKHLYKETVIMPLTLSIIPIIFWIAVAAVVIVAILMAHRTTRLRYDVIQLAIKEGKELPPDIFRNGHRRRRGDPLLAGLVLTASGVALAIALGAVAGWVQAVWGLIPLFIGIALLIYVPFWRKQKKEDQEKP
jgi:hypothetical protein